MAKCLFALGPTCHIPSSSHSFFSHGWRSSHARSSSHRGRRRVPARWPTTRPDVAWHRRRRRQGYATRRLDTASAAGEGAPARAGLSGSVLGQRSGPTWRPAMRPGDMSGGAPSTGPFARLGAADGGGAIQRCSRCMALHPNRGAIRQGGSVLTGAGQAPCSVGSGAAVRRAEE